MKKYNEFINSNIISSNIDIFKYESLYNTTILHDQKKSKEELEEISLKELGKKGQLIDYIKQEDVTFGMLKAVYQDAVDYKKKREYSKGVAKFALRAIPLAIGPLFFPIWLLSQILGSTRAINKIIVPALRMGSYDSFIKTLVVRTMNFAEGDIKPLLGRDWFYEVFHVSDGLIKMVRKEHVYEFAAFISKEVENKKDDQIVPDFWLDNEFRKWLNNRFDLDLPTGKTMIKHKTK